MNSERKNALLNFFLMGWALAAIFSTGLHFCAGLWTANGTIWGYSPGWQREIGLWDLFAFFVLMAAAKKGAIEAKRFLACALVGLSIALGINHLIALINSNGLYLHWAGTTANLVAISIGSAAIFKTRESPAAHFIQ
jgi:hypothetical protein